MSGVNSVNTYDNHPILAFGPITNGVAAGIVTGYAAKYVIPLTDAEKGPNYAQYISGIRESANKTKGIVIDEIRHIKNKTPAQDLFIKMVDAHTENDKHVNMAENIVALSDNDRLEYQELLKQIKTADADKSTVIKNIRNSEKKTTAQELFLKLVDADTEIKKRANSMRKFLHENNLTEEAKKEFLDLVEQVNNKGKQSFKEFVSMYNSGLKRIKRPAMTFMTAGAAVGLIAGVLDKAFFHSNP